MDLRHITDVDTGKYDGDDKLDVVGRRRCGRSMLTVCRDLRQLMKFNDQM